MRIGIDARLLSLSLTGIGRYTLEMTREMIKSGDEYFLYSPAPVIHGQWVQSNVSLREETCNSRAGRMLWSQTRLPYLARLDKLDVFWGPTHRLPKFLPSSMACVVTIHDLVWRHAGDTMRPLSRIMEKVLMPQAIKLADLVVADSLSTRNAVEDEFAKARERLRVVYPGVTRLPEPVDESRLQKFGIDRPYFLFVGTLEPRKNLERLLQAYASLSHDERDSALLVIAGGTGWGKVNPTAIIDQLGLNDNVRLTGYVTDEDLATLYARARFLAMPSIYEGFGFPVLEAMIYGVPVLTSTSSSLPEVAGKAGLLVDPLDVASIANGLHQLIGDDSLRNELARHSLDNAARFDWTTAATNLLQVFSDAVAMKKSS